MVYSLGKLGETRGVERQQRGQECIEFETDKYYGIGTWDVNNKEIVIP